MGTVRTVGTVTVADEVLPVAPPHTCGKSLGLPWGDPAMTDGILDAMAAGVPLPVVAKAIGVIPKTIQNHLGGRHDLDARRRRTVQGVANLLGYHKLTVKGWAEAGYLRVARHGEAKAAWTFVDDGDLLDFLSNPTYWPLWEPHRIADPDARRWAEQARRRGPVWLTPKEAAKLAGVRKETILDRIADGRLRANRLGRCHLYVSRDDVLSSRKPPPVRRRWLAGEGRLLVALRRRGVPFPNAAAALGRGTKPCRVRYCAWRTGRKPLPPGVSPSDLISDAEARALRRARRVGRPGRTRFDMSAFEHEALARLWRAGRFRVLADAAFAFDCSTTTVQNVVKGRRKPPRHPAQKERA